MPRTLDQFPYILTVHLFKSLRREFLEPRFPQPLERVAPGLEHQPAGRRVVGAVGAEGDAARPRAPRLPESPPQWVRRVRQVLRSVPFFSH